MSEDVIDVKEFMERVQDDKELLLELFEIFLEDYKEKRQKLGEAIASKNFEEIRNIAHSLKGASGNISAKQMRESFLQLEEKGKDKDSSDMEDILKSVDKQFDLVTSRIEELKSELA